MGLSFKNYVRQACGLLSFKCIFLSVLFSDTVNSVPQIMRETKFHTHTNLSVKLVLFSLIFMFLNDGKTKDYKQNGNMHSPNFISS